MANSTDSSSDRNSPVHHGTFSPADNGATSQGSDLLLFGTVLGAILSLVDDSLGTSTFCLAFLLASIEGNTWKAAVFLAAFAYVWLAFTVTAFAAAAPVLWILAESGFDFQPARTVPGQPVAHSSLEGSQHEPPNLHTGRFSTVAKEEPLPQLLQVTEGMLGATQDSKADSLGPDTPEKQMPPVASRSVKRQGTELPLAAPHESEMPETPTVPATHLSQPAEMFLQEHKSNTHAAFKAGAAKSIISITASARVGDNQVRSDGHIPAVEPSKALPELKAGGAPPLVAPEGPLENCSLPRATLQSAQAALSNQLTMKGKTAGSEPTVDQGVRRRLETLKVLEVKDDNLASPQHQAYNGLISAIYPSSQTFRAQQSSVRELAEVFDARGKLGSWLPLPAVTKVAASTGRWNKLDSGKFLCMGTPPAVFLNGRRFTSSPPKSTISMCRSI